MFIPVVTLSPRYAPLVHRRQGPYPPGSARTHTHTHTHTHIHTHTHTLPNVQGASTHLTAYPGRWPGNTHARPPSDVNKPRTHGPRAPVQGLFSPSHVLSHTAPGPAWADADARQPALPLPARLRRLSARAPKMGPITPAPRQACFGRVSAPPDLCPSPPTPTPQASRPGEGSTGAPTE